MSYGYYANFISTTWPYGLLRLSTYIIGAENVLASPGVYDLDEVDEQLAMVEESAKYDGYRDGMYFVLSISH